MTNTEGFTGRAGEFDPRAGSPLADPIPPIGGVGSSNPLTDPLETSTGVDNPWRAGSPLAPGPVGQHSVDPWDEPPPATGAFAQQSSTDHDEPSTADVAKDQAASVAGGATDAAKDVAGVAKEQVAQVATEARQQVKHLVGQARTELTEQAQLQQERAASGLQSIASQLRSMAYGSNEPGMATDLAHEAADKAQQLAGWLENRDPGSVLDEVRAFARQRPGVFLAMSLGAGIVAGRLARGLAADPEDTSTPSPSAAALTREPPARPALDPSRTSVAPSAGTPGFVDNGQTIGGVGR